MGRGTRYGAELLQSSLVTYEAPVRVCIVSAGMSSADTAADRAPRWRIWVDTGGTFTDCVAVAPDGTTHRAKVLSSSALRGRSAPGSTRTEVRVESPWSLPDGFFAGCTFRALAAEAPSLSVSGWDARHGTLILDGPLPEPPPAGARFEVIAPEEAPLLAARMVTRTPFGATLPPTAMRVATTRGTNALLERRGAPTALFVTRGFADLLLVGTQQRPDLFTIDVVKPAPLYAIVAEVDERLAADGSVLRPLDEDALRAEARRVRASGIAVAAVALMHSYRNPEHERAVAEVLRSEGFEHVSASAELAPLIKLLPRAQTAVVDATLSPVISDYLSRIAASLDATTSTLHVMTSAGGLVRAASFRPRDSLLSGPAGGVVGAAPAGASSGHGRVIGFDMGGTSTDVSRFDGDFEYLFEHTVGDATLVAPALAIETVAAGGGSICSFDGDRLRVGPESAGAAPGPACYGAGGPLTITDVNLLLGRLDPDRFGIPVDVGAARARLDEILVAVGADTAPESLLQGFLRIADERMADAIRRISLRRGYDPADYAMVAFGGAGGQHACAVAALLGIPTVIVPPDGGLLSAVGLGRAVVERFAQRQILQPLDDVEGTLGDLLGALEHDAVAAVEAEGVPRKDIAVRRRIANLRFVGQDTAVAVEMAGGISAREGFERAYLALYGYTPEHRPVELESLRVVASSSAGATPAVPPPPELHPATATASRRAFVGGGWTDVAVHERSELGPGSAVAGPALVLERHSATVVDHGWRAVVDGAGALSLTGTGDEGAR